MKNEAFLITYGGYATNGKAYFPYKAIAHTAEDAISVINTWKSYGKANGNNITVNERIADKIRAIFKNGIGCYGNGEPRSCSEQLRTCGCGAWGITFHPALASTVEEHERICKEKREAIKAKRMLDAEKAIQRRTEELNEQKRGWYYVELELTAMVFNEHGNDYRKRMTFSGNVIADSGMDAYGKAVKSIKEDGITSDGDIAVVESWASHTSRGYNFLFMGVKTDDGYSVEKWKELKEKGEI